MEGSPLILASDWFREDHVTQFWPMRYEEDVLSRASGKIFLILGLQKLPNSYGGHVSFQLLW